ncbi:hypothetical protein BDW22DRAFT_1387429 [Trametopsis cervina]|nr:hypothetical protein BDW22DRAFT_1387429 [Trametopsis cervina]
MASTTSVYRSVVREINRSATSPRVTRNAVVTANFRALFEKQRSGEDKERFDHDIQNAITFMRSQRTHKELLDRYNPLHDLTSEERIRATARRVGLDMPLKGGDSDN